MTHRSRFPALLLPFALLASIPRLERPAEEQLRALLATYEASLNAGDGGRIEQLYAEDGVFMPAGFRRRLASRRSEARTTRFLRTSVSRSTSPSTS